MSELNRLGDVLKGRSVVFWRDVLGRWRAQVAALGPSGKTFRVESLEDLSAKIEAFDTTSVVADPDRAKEVAGALEGSPLELVPYGDLYAHECIECGGSGAEGERPCRRCEGYGTIKELPKR